MIASLGPLGSVETTRINPAGTLREHPAEFIILAVPVELVVGPELFSDIQHQAMIFLLGLQEPRIGIGQIVPDASGDESFERVDGVGVVLWRLRRHEQAMSLEAILFGDYQVSWLNRDPLAATIAEVREVDMGLLEGGLREIRI